MIARIAAHQHGVITYGQLLWAGLSRAAIHRRVRSGRLFRVHRGVYALGHAGIGNKGRWKAATLAYGDGAVLSHVSAAALWRLIDSADGPCSRDRADHERA